MKTIFSSALAPVIEQYLTIKQALGRRYDFERRIFISLDQFLTDTTDERHELTAETFLQWCQTMEHVRRGVRRNRMRVVRNLCLYRRRREPGCFVPDPSLFPQPHQPVRPYIFSESEIRRLLDETHRLKRTGYSPLRPELFHLIVVLLFTTGLRRGELLRLKVADYNPREATLLIHASKFHKSRLLPLPDDVRREVDCYLEARRRRRLIVTSDTPLVWNSYQGGRAYTPPSLRWGLEQLLEAAKIRTPDGRLPRTHDFRHSFAVNALLRWYRSGVDVQAKLPFLAAYMGHVSMVSTYYYLHFVEPLASLASARFANTYGGLVGPIPSRKEVSDENNIS
jgi:integrase/recombinase XerD